MAKMDLANWTAGEPCERHEQGWCADCRPVIVPEPAPVAVPVRKPRKPAFQWTYRSVNTALKAVDVAVRETLADNPELGSVEDSVYWEICQAIRYDTAPAARRELARVTGVTLIER